MMIRLCRQVLESSFWKDSDGQDLVEYALAAGLVTVAAVAVMPGLSGVTGSVFSKIESMVTAYVH